MTAAHCTSSFLALGSPTPSPSSLRPTPPSPYCPSSPPAPSSTALASTAVVAPNVVVLNWENVLAPVTWMKHHLGLRATIEAVEDVKRQIAQSSYLQQALAAVEEQMLDLVRTSATIGPLYILTKLSMPAMEAICAACFPRVAFWLTNVNSFPNFHRVQVVAATAALKTSVEFTSWRVKVFQQICRDQGANYGPTLRGSTQALQVAESGAFSLISVTTSEADVFACVKTIDIAPFLVPKCIRVRGVQCNHSLEDFYAHLRTLQMYIQTSAAHPTAFSTTL